MERARSSGESQLNPKSEMLMSYPVPGSKAKDLIPQAAGGGLGPGPLVWKRVNYCTSPHPINSYSVIFNHRNLLLHSCGGYKTKTIDLSIWKNLFRGFASLASGNRRHSLACLCFALLCIHLHTAPSVTLSKHPLWGLFMCGYVGGHWERHGLT